MLARKYLLEPAFIDVREAVPGRALRVLCDASADQASFSSVFWNLHNQDLTESDLPKINAQMIADKQRTSTRATASCRLWAILTLGTKINRITP